jgi:hypothetical protein
MHFENYKPERFASLYADVGPKLRQFFASPVVLALLEGSVKLRRPAVEAIEERLLQHAKDDVQNQRVRQLVGHMIRHLMAELGYELDQPEVRLPSGVLFTCGARYRVAKRRRSKRRRVAAARSGDSTSDTARSEGENDSTARQTVVFLPWTVVETTFAPDGIELRHFRRDDSRLSPDVQRVLKAYERIPGQPVESATLLALAGEIGGPTTDIQVEEAFAFREALSFAGMRDRAFFDNSGYCNDHTFTCVAQAYVPGSPGATAVSRRRDGRSMTYLAEEYHRVHCPHHVRPETRIVIDGSLLRALSTAWWDPACSWLQDGVELFNLANTDSSLTRTHTEVSLSVAAIQRLLGVEKKSDGAELAEHFAEVLYGGSPSQLTIADSPRTHNSTARSLAQAWFFDLYSDRSPVAHGRPRPLDNRRWSRDEHLLLASYIAPRVTLLRLAAAGHYELTDRDREELAAFEYLLCLNDVFGSGDSAPSGLPERLLPAPARYLWYSALRTAEREQHIRHVLGGSASSTL